MMKIKILAGVHFSLQLSSSLLL